ncbi:MAG: radical SAM protein [Clostridiales bacterium]|nr:radical SAM protein [Clostridiales bacterium]
MYNIDKKIFIREELNGITVYDIVKNIYKFYEGVDLKEYLSKNKNFEKNKFEKFLEENKNAISSNLKVKYPFRINWLISDVCNLDCIYCCANNKMNPAKLDRELLKETAKHILTLSPLTVGLTGGEPTLCPEIGSIIDILDGKCAIVIDTNGTTSNLEKYIDKIKNSNTTVRITIDSMDNDISNKVRPYDENQINKIKRNIELLKQNNVRVSVHTVVTKTNYDSIIEIGRYLRKYKIEKWQLYPVNYSEKCKDFFDEIKVSDEELKKLEKELNKELEKDMLIRVYRNQVDFRAKGVIFANSIGEFYTDTIFNGIDMIGEKPSLQKLIEHTNVENHIKDYLFN